jgi:hypothetical protein
MPLTVEDFLKHVQESSKEGFRVLSQQWLHECCDIVDDYREEIESMTPRNTVSIIII